MDAVNDYAKMWASSTVSLKNGDDGDRLVKFPVISLCKPADKDMEGGMQVNKGSKIGGMWKKVEACKGWYLVHVFLHIQNSDIEFFFNS